MKPIFHPFGNVLVQLRLMTEADLETTIAWRNRDDARIWFKNSQIITMDQHRAWFAQYALKHDDFLFVVENRNQPVGQASVYGIDWEKGIAEVGRFLVAPEAGGRGFIGLACSELLQFCQRTLNLRSVFLEVKENNERAIRIYERNGFQEEARTEGMVRMSRSLNRGLARSAYAGETAITGR